VGYVLAGEPTVLTLLCLRLLCLRLLDLLGMGVLLWMRDGGFVFVSVVVAGGAFDFDFARCSKSDTLMIN